MEISLLSKESLKIRGKNSALAVDSASPKDSTSTSADKKDKSIYSAVIGLNLSADELLTQSGSVVIDRPGEYEVGGIKMNATQGDGGIIFNPIVDGIEILLGKLSTFEKMQHKLKEQHIVIVYVDCAINASFITSLASHALIFYGKTVGEITKSLGAENTKHLSKYSITFDKLPQEVETIILE